MVTRPRTSPGGCTHTTAFNRKIGLDKEGQPPAGATFVSRTMPAGTVVRAYRPEEATVDVWCTGLFGLTDKDAQEIPLKTSWFTMTVTVRWTHDGWRVSEFSRRTARSPPARRPPSSARRRSPRRSAAETRRRPRRHRGTQGSPPDVSPGT
ncbi:hypothetical protein ACFTY7_06510 [Streptomyces sp. NPDC057062]|uniref:hypothetical protein n=1 Tax=Streptomyces sp. NPDC057062 TaxID=3346011 RepID=UPI0036291057